MREVYATTEQLGINSEDIVTIVLMDYVGAECKNPAFKIDAVTSNNSVRAELLENDVLCINTYYNLKLPNGNILPFLIKSSPLFAPDKPLDIPLLILGGCFKGLIDLHKKTINSEYVKKFENFLLHKNPHFKENENKLTKKYIKYADTAHHQQVATNDECFLMDRLLSQIGLENATTNI